ncbi:hypothetical protein JCM24511_05550 [Saitozyma sp. JCM 24511]|nr:hypothetical protein JCM24511_05550 [Saitozyma sp. JCM 24511]
MAPSTHYLRSELAGRQSLPTCVYTCLSAGTLGDCTDLGDYSCICNSQVYLASVGSCFGLSCNANDTTFGIEYIESGCQAFGVNATVPISTSTNSSSTATSTNAASTDTTSAPKLWQKRYFDVQAIMSSICAALFVIALIIGFLSCRARVRKEKQMSQNRSWTGVGGSTYGNSSKHKSAFGGSSRGAQSSAFTNSRNATTTFDSFGVTSSNFGGASQNQSVSFGPVLDRETRGVNRGFTNRLTLGDMGEAEEWEMEVKDGASSVGADKKDVEVNEEEGGVSPTASTSRMGNESEVELGGSTVHLTKLDKGDGPHAI